jgi:hypothetical protein
MSIVDNGKPKHLQKIECTVTKRKFNWMFSPNFNAITWNKIDKYTFNTNVNHFITLCYHFFVFKQELVLGRWTYF